MLRLFLLFSTFLTFPIKIHSPSSDEDVLKRLAIRGDDLDLDDLDAPLPFRLTLRSLGVNGVLPYLLSCCSSSSKTFCLKWLLSWPREGTGELELVGVCVREAFLDDFLVSGDWSILCFHSSSRFIDSSR